MSDDFILREEASDDDDGGEENQMIWSSYASWSDDDDEEDVDDDEAETTSNTSNHRVPQQQQQGGEIASVSSSASFPLVRDHSYLPSMHPLYTPNTDSNRDSSAAAAASATTAFADTHSTTTRRLKRNELQPLIVLELPVGVVVFPFDRVPIRLNRHDHSSRCMRELAQHIDAARRHPGSTPPVRLGIVVKPDPRGSSDRNHTTTTSRGAAAAAAGGRGLRGWAPVATTTATGGVGSSSRQQQQRRSDRDRLARRESWTRRGMGPERLRRISQRLQQELGDLDDDDDEEEEEGEQQQQIANQTQNSSAQQRSSPSTTDTQPPQQQQQQQYETENNANRSAQGAPVAREQIPSDASARITNNNTHQESAAALAAARSRGSTTNTNSNHLDENNQANASSSTSSSPSDSAAAAARSTTRSGLVSLSAQVARQHDARDQTTAAAGQESGDAAGRGDNRDSDSGSDRANTNTAQAAAERRHSWNATTSNNNNYDNNNDTDDDDNQRQETQNLDEQAFGDWLFIQRRPLTGPNEGIRVAPLSPLGHIFGGWTIDRNYYANTFLSREAAIENRIRSLNMLVGLYGGDTLMGGGAGGGLGGFQDGPTFSANNYSSGDTKPTWKGRVGTIVTIMCTNGEDSTDGNGVWQSLEDQDEIVFTGLGKSRFRIVSSLDDESGTNVHNNRNPYAYHATRSHTIGRYLVEEIEDERIPQPPHIPPIPVTHYHPLEQPFHRARQRQRQTIHGLSIITPIPEWVYRKFWPWRLAMLVRQALKQTPTFRGVLESLTSLEAAAAPVIPPTTTSSSSSKRKQEQQQQSGDGATITEDSAAECENGPLSAAAPETTTMGPVQFAYWMASNMPLGQDEKVDLLELDTTVERLQYLLQKILEVEKAESIIHCKRCGIPLTKANSLFTVGGAEGTSGNYVNMYGHVHQTITVRVIDEDEIRFQGLPETRDSWFPGYSWRIMNCGCCMAHLGWRFASVVVGGTAGAPSQQQQQQRLSSHTAGKKNLPDRPLHFYGLCASSVSTYVPESRHRRQRRQRQQQSSSS